MGQEHRIQSGSLIGKGYLTAYWVGECGLLRFYARGLGSANDAGTLVPGDWVHWAVTADASVVRHYINGVLVNEFDDEGLLATNELPVRIANDAHWDVSISGRLTEIRLWNVARTEEDIASTMNFALTEPQAGLVAVWSLNEDASDALGVHHGVIVGTLTFDTP